MGGLEEPIVESSVIEESIIQLGDHLIPVLDSNIGSNGISVISNLRPKSNFLSGLGRIWNHTKILNEEGTHTKAPSCSIPDKSSGRKIPSPSLPAFLIAQYLPLP